jgi:hypothetical protein
LPLQQGYENYSINENFETNINNEHILTAFIGKYEYPQSVIRGCTEFINKIYSKTTTGACDDDFKNLFNNTHDTNIADITKQLIFDCLQAVFNGNDLVPKAVMMKYGVGLLSGAFRTLADYKGAFAGYFLSVVFSVLDISKKELDKVDSVLRATDANYRIEATSKGKCYFDTAAFQDGKAYKKYKIATPDADEKYLAKSLAFIYNYCRIDGNNIIISNEAEALAFSRENGTIEHFLINDNGVRVGRYTRICKYPSPAKNISKSIFNFIFVPRLINNNILSNFDANKKLSIIHGHENEITNAYSLKVLEIINDAEVNFGFPDWNNEDNTTNPQAKVDEYFSTWSRTGFLMAYERYAEKLLNAVKTKLLIQE